MSGWHGRKAHSLQLDPRVQITAHPTSLVLNLLPLPSSQQIITPASQVLGGRAKASQALAAGPPQEPRTWNCPESCGPESPVIQGLVFTIFMATPTQTTQRQRHLKTP